MAGQEWKWTPGFELLINKCEKSSLSTQWMKSFFDLCISKLQMGHLMKKCENSMDLSTVYKQITRILSIENICTYAQIVSKLFVSRE